MLLTVSGDELLSHLDKILRADPNRTTLDPISESNQEFVADD